MLCAGGQFVSVLVGCVCRNIFPDSVNWVAAPVAVGFSVLAMMVTRTVHPPGGLAATIWHLALTGHMLAARNGLEVGDCRRHSTCSRAFCCNPAGGATALMVASEMPHGRWASFIYVPAVMVGSFGMFIIAMVTNLVAPGRRYPTFW